MFHISRPHRLLRKVIPGPRRSPQLKAALSALAAEARASALASRKTDEALADRIASLAVERARVRQEAEAVEGIAQTLEERGLL